MKIFSLKLIIACLVAFSGNVLACSCPDPSQRQRFREADSVFVGEVVEFKERLGRETNEELIPYPFIVKFKVEKQWKGQKLNEITALVSFDIKGFCNDLSLPVGKRLLIYAPRLSRQLLINRECGPNRYAEYAKDEISHLGNIFFRFYSFIFPYPKI